MSEKMSTISDSISREIQRIKYFVIFGSELSSIHFTTKSSFLSLFRERELKTKTQLKCLKNLFLSSEKSKELETTIVKRLEAIIVESRDDNKTAILAFNLFLLQSNTIQSEFRKLAIRLALTLKSKAFLQFCHLLGKKRINSSKSVRKVIISYYSRDLSEQQLEDILLFRHYLDWTHKDLIRLCHIPPNPLTKSILFQDSKDETIIDKRVKVLRSEKSRDHELVAALDESTLETHDWFLALNSVHSANVLLRKKSILALKDNQLLKIICSLVTRFPNNKSLFEEVIYALKNCSKVSKVLKNFILFFLKNNSMNSMKTTLETTIQLMDTLDSDFGSVVVIVDEKVDLQRLYLSDLKDKKRRKLDLMDKMLLKDFFVLFFSSFSNLLALEEDNRVVPLSLDQPISGHQLEVISPEVLNANHVIYLTEREIDLNFWKPFDTKLIICYFNRKEIKNLGFFRPNEFRSEKTSNALIVFNFYQNITQNTSQNGTNLTSEQRSNDWIHGIFNSLFKSTQKPIQLPSIHIQTIKPQEDNH